MPTVKKKGVAKTFPYTKAGREAAKRYAASGDGKASKSNVKKKKRGY